MIKKQAGFMLLVIAVLLVVIAALANGLVVMISSGGSAATSMTSNLSARDLAYAGVEEGSYDLSQNNCSSVWSTETELGSGSYQYNCTQYNLASALSAALTNTATSIPVTSTTGFASFGAVTIDSEMIYYNGISGNTLLNANRGMNGTSAASHTLGTAVSQQQYIINGRGSVPASSNPDGQDTISQAVLMTQGGNLYYAVGANGTVFSFDGTAWSSVFTVSSVTLRGIHVSTNYGLIVGSDSSNRSYVYVFNGSSWAGPLTLTVSTSYNNGGSFSTPTVNSYMSNSNLYSVTCDTPLSPTQCWIGGGATLFGSNQPGPLLCRLTTAGVATCFVNTGAGNTQAVGMDCNRATCISSVNNNNFYDFYSTSSAPWITYNGSATVPLYYSPVNSGSQTTYVSCMDANRCISANGNAIRNYYNSTGSYAQININGFSPTGVSCPSSSLCMIGGSNGQVYNCAMGATSISCVRDTSLTGSNNLTDIHCNSANDCMAVSSGSRSYRYLNGTWTNISVPGGVSLNAVSGSSNGGGGTAGIQWINSN